MVGGYCSLLKVWVHWCVAQEKHNKNSNTVTKRGYKYSDSIPTWLRYVILRYIALDILVVTSFMWHHEDMLRGKTNKKQTKQTTTKNRIKHSILKTRWAVKFLCYAMFFFVFVFFNWTIRTYRLVSAFVFDKSNTSVTIFNASVAILTFPSYFACMTQAQSSPIFKKNATKNGGWFSNQMNDASWFDSSIVFKKKKKVKV